MSGRNHTCPAHDEGLFTYQAIVFIVSFRHPVENFDNPVDLERVVFRRIPVLINKSTSALKSISLVDSVGFEGHIRKYE
jgi:hypothetical protein